MARNKGQDYEVYINDLLEKKNLFPLHLKNNLDGKDSAFKHRGVIYFLELKNNVAPDFGQKGLKWSETGGWEWTKRDEITDMYDLLGVIDKINKNFKPNLFTVSPTAFTAQHRIQDQKNFEKTIDLDQKRYLHTYYARKNCYYIQVEDKGFYHLEQDIAKLGVPQFDPDLTLRLRAKVRSSLPVSNYAFWAVIRVKQRSIRKTEFDLEENGDKRFPPIEG